MFDDVLPHNDVAIRILKTADSLMATEGIQHLSTHKIAKAAGVSVGTIYLYFKDKDELLDQLVRFLFHDFHHYLETYYQPDLPFFEQYRALWWATLKYMRANPNVILNMHQYESLPSFQNMIKRCLESEVLTWQKFITAGQKLGEFANLPGNVLLAMSMKVIFQLMFIQLRNDEMLSDDIIEEVISRTWKTLLI